MVTALAGVIAHITQATPMPGVAPDAAPAADAPAPVVDPPDPELPMLCWAMMASASACWRPRHINTGSVAVFTFTPPDRVLPGVVVSKSSTFASSADFMLVLTAKSKIFLNVLFIAWPDICEARLASLRPVLRAACRAF